MGLINALNSANSAIAASQLAIDVTGQNIANANTEGYSRKRVTVSADAVKDPNLGQVGTGVNINGIERIRNVFIDQQIGEQTTSLGYYEEVDNALERIENIFTEPSDHSLNSALDNFWNSWNDLSNSPNDLSAREAVKSTTQVLVNNFRAVSGELRDFKISLDDQLEKTLDKVNDLTQKIYFLNEEIATIELNPGQHANDSRDKRDQLLVELQNEIDVEYFEDGQGKITVTANGNVLVTPSETVDLELYRKTEYNNEGELSSSTAVRFSNTKIEYVPKDGAVGAILHARDNIIPKYDDHVNHMAEALVTGVNDVHITGYNLDGDTGVYFFNPEYTTAGTIRLASAIDTNVSQIAAAGGSVLKSPGDTTLGLPATTSPQGIGYVPITLAVGFPTDNTIDLTDAGVNAAYYDKYTDWAQGSVQLVDRSTGDILTEGAGKDYLVDYENGTVTILNTIYTAGDQFDITFKYNDGGFDGIGDGDSALRIANLRNAALTAPDIDGENTQTLNEYYASFIGQLGIEKNEASSTLETRSFILEQLNKRQSEISGVSLDEELTNMIKFEHSFQAAARMISTIDEMLQQLISLGG